MVPGLVPIVKLQDVSILKTVEDTYLIEYLLSSVLLDGFDSDVVDGLLFSTLVNNRVLAFADLLVDMEIVHF